jgi:hypothetical protein
VFPERAEKQPACVREAASAKGGGLAAADLTGRVIGLAIKVHKTVGPGRLEQIYEDCQCHGMALNGLAFQRQVEWSLICEGVRCRALTAPIPWPGNPSFLRSSQSNKSGPFTKHRV